MYALRNKVQLIGCVGKEPEIKLTEKGKKWARFCIATNESYRNAKGERITDTQWHTIIAWGKLTEMAEKYLQKGKDTVIEGKLLSRSYTDKEGSSYCFPGESRCFTGNGHCFTYNSHCVTSDRHCFANRNH